MIDSIAKLCLTAVALFVVTSSAASQPSGPQQDRAVSSSEKSQVIAGALDSLQKFYFSHAAAERVANRIREREKRGEYRAINSANMLARVLSENLQAEAKDLHLRIIYSAEAIPPKPAASAQPSPERVARMKAFHAHRNFGLSQLSRLPGNLGYMEMTGFADTSLASDALAAAMTFLSNTDALIIDLRNNRGGEPEMQSLLASYFFPEKTLLSTFVSDDPARIQENWTRPVRGQPYLKKPVYILTSARVTFSAAEGFSYIMKAFGKAEIVGEKTGGGSNPSDGYILNRNFAIIIPYATPVVAVTKANWAGGVIPDIPSSADDALRVAQIAALETLLRSASDDLTQERSRALETLKAQTPTTPKK